jgi:hypothetical protein
MAIYLYMNCMEQNPSGQAENGRLRNSLYWTWRFITVFTKALPLDAFLTQTNPVMWHMSYIDMRNVILDFYTLCPSARYGVLPHPDGYAIHFSWQVRAKLEPEVSSRLFSRGGPVPSYSHEPSGIRQICKLVIDYFGRYFFKWSRGSSVSVVSDYGLDDRGSIPDRGRGFFSLAFASRPALGPTQPPVQWVPRVLSPGVKRGRVLMLTTHNHLVPRPRMSTSYASSPLKRLHGV